MSGMKVGILCAGDREAAPFLPMIRDCVKTEKAMLAIYEGTIGNVNVAALFSGVCKVNAAIAAQILIDTYGCGAIINAGTAGGLAAELDVLDTVVCTEAVYHDVAAGILTDFHPWMETPYFRSDERLLQMAHMAAERMKDGHRTFFGRMATGETFICDEQREDIIRRCQPMCVDMETAAVAHVCYVNRIPFAAVRTITDSADQSSSGSFEQNCQSASRRSADFVKIMLQTAELS